MTTPIDMHAHREKMRKDSREQAEAIFKLAGFVVTRVWELANGYWPDAPDYDDVRTPWWLFLTAHGPIQIGWRKRVLHIQWDACAFRGAVTTDDVTKDNVFVHASSVEKAIDYLRALRECDIVRRGDVPASKEPRGHSSGCASTRGSGGDDCDCGWTR